MSTRRPIKIDLGLATIIAAVIAAIVAVIVAIINNVGEGGSTPSSPSNGVISAAPSDRSEASSSSSITMSSTSSSISDLGDSDSNSTSDEHEPIHSSSKSESAPSPDDSNPDNSSGSLESSNPIKKITYDYGKVELFSSGSGIAYISKQFIAENYIGRIDGNKQVIGWVLTFLNNEKSFAIFVVPAPRETIERNFFKCDATYSINNENVKLYSDGISAKLKEEGDIQIEFNINDIPFDLTSAHFVFAGTYIG